MSKDLALADEIEAGSISRFADDWLAGPLFANDGPEVNALARAEIEKNSPTNLAAALRGMSIGRMEPLWPRLAEIAAPTTVVAGQSDGRYVELAEQIADSIDGSELELVDGAGHALPRSTPERLAALF